MILFLEVFASSTTLKFDFIPGYCGSSYSRFSADDVRCHQRRCPASIAGERTGKCGNSTEP